MAGVSEVKQDNEYGPPMHPGRLKTLGIICLMFACNGGLFTSYNGGDTDGDLLPPTPAEGGPISLEQKNTVYDYPAELSQQGLLANVPERLPITPEAEAVTTILTADLNCCNMRKVVDIIDSQENPALQQTMRDFVSAELATNSPKNIGPSRFWIDSIATKGSPDSTSSMAWQEIAANTIRQEMEDLRAHIDALPSEAVRASAMRLFELRTVQTIVSLNERYAGPIQNELLNQLSDFGVKLLKYINDGSLNEDWLDRQISGLRESIRELLQESGDELRRMSIGRIKLINRLIDQHHAALDGATTSKEESARARDAMLRVIHNALQDGGSAEALQQARQLIDTTPDRFAAEKREAYELLDRFIADVVEEKMESIRVRRQLNNMRDFLVMLEDMRNSILLVENREDAGKLWAYVQRALADTAADPATSEEMREAINKRLSFSLRQQVGACLAAPKGGTDGPCSGLGNDYESARLELTGSGLVVTRPGFSLLGLVGYLQEATLPLVDGSSYAADHINKLVASSIAPPR